MLDTIFWQRQAILKRQMDSLERRVTSLERNSRPRRGPMTDRLKTVTTWANLLITGHGLWPILAAAFGIGWKIISKVFF